MAIEIIMPRMGLTMEEGTIAVWLKSEGDSVKAGEPLLEIETDKVRVEIESPDDGILGRILAREGETLPIGTVIGYLVEEGESIPEQIHPKLSLISSSSEISTQGDQIPQSFMATAQNTTDRVKASPAARRLAQEIGIDLREVSGTGPRGRVVVKDVEVAADKKSAVSKRKRISPLARRLLKEFGIDRERVVGTGPGGRITREDVERAATVQLSKTIPVPKLQSLSRTHQIMANRMVASFSSAPHFYLHAESDTRNLIALRKTLLPEIEKQIGIRVTFTDLMVKLCASVLLKHPNVLAQWNENGLLVHADINIGVAVDTQSGLVVPVLKNADQKRLAEIVQLRSELIERAQSGRLSPQDLELGFFTISNLGMFRIDFFEAILNPPQAAILAIGQIKQRAIVENGQVIPAPMMNLSLSIDHRVLDGAAGAQFLTDLVEAIEDPSQSLAK